MFYFINVNNQEVHRKDYSCLLIGNKVILSEFASLGEAVTGAKKQGYHRAKSCYFCSDTPMIKAKFL
ncbi:hypothetical protein NRK67_01290 [Fusobacteria bacterium ZRK30]|nr:hypothetical protein NRK67_01290 [Fusobacteria bacterium ZRK30]